MTVIRPNSISGVTSITALTQSIEFYKSDGSLSGANIDGISVNTAGIVTASKFYGDGSNLTGISAGTSLSGSTNNTVCTVTGANAIQGEANLTFDGNTLSVDGGSNSQTFATNSTNSNGNMLQVKCSGTTKLFLGSAGSFVTGNTGTTNQGIRAEGDLLFAAGGHTERFRVKSNGNIGINQTNPAVELDIKATSPEIRLTCSDANLDQGDTIGQIGWYTTDPTTPGGAGTVSYINTFSANGNGADYSTKIFNRDGSGGGSTQIQLGNAAGSIVFGTNTTGNAATTRLTIASDGKLTVAGTGAIRIPAGTTGQRPGSSVVGDIRYNSTSNTLEFYTGSAWVGTNVSPSLNSITGDIFNGLTGRTLVISCNDISASGNDVKYSNNSTGAVIATDTSATTSGSNITSTIPAAVYNTAAGTVIKIEVINSAGVISSNSLTKTILASPSGGTITSSGGYRYHTFTSSGTFVNTIASLSVQYLVVAGGGGGGGNQGGGAGGAGGYRTGSATLGTGNYSASVGGGGGNGGNGNSGHGNDGGNSSFNSLTSTGGGGGVNMNTNTQTVNGRSGGSGGGASHWLNGNGSGGSGTSGQGNGGGDARDTEGLGHNGGGGGGAGGAGSDGLGAYGGNGGNGSTWLNGVTYAGGGGGGCYYSNNSGGSSNYSIGGGAGTGGGGRGSRNTGSKLSTNYSSPTTNQHGVDGYGGGGGGGGNQPGDGGDGVVIVRYAG